MAAPSRPNQVVRRVIDDLVEFSGETSVDGYMSFFKGKQISSLRGFINRMREEVTTLKNEIGQFNALIAVLEGLGEGEDLFDTLHDLKHDKEKVRAKLQSLIDLIVDAEEEVHTKEEQIEAMTGWRVVSMGCEVSFVWSHIFMFYVFCLISMVCMYEQLKWFHVWNYWSVVNVININGELD